jgi:hypothetical protein
VVHRWSPSRRGSSSAHSWTLFESVGDLTQPTPVALPPRLCDRSVVCVSLVEKFAASSRLATDPKNRGSTSDLNTPRRTLRALNRGRAAADDRRARRCGIEVKSK